MTKLMTESEINALVTCYIMGCATLDKPVNNDAMLDLVNLAKMTRSLHLLINMVIAGSLPVIYERGKLSIITGDNQNIEVSKML